MQCHREIVRNVVGAHTEEVIVAYGVSNMNDKVAGLSAKIDNCNPQFFLILTHHSNCRCVTAEDDPVNLNAGRSHRFFKVGKVGFLCHDNIDIHFHPAGVHSEGIFNEILVIYPEVVGKHMDYFIFIGYIGIVKCRLHDTVDLLDGDVFVWNIDNACRVEALGISIGNGNSCRSNIAARNAFGISDSFFDGFGSQFNVGDGTFFDALGFGDTVAQYLNLAVIDFRDDRTDLRRTDIDR